MKKIVIITSLIFLFMGMGICSQNPPPTPPITSNHDQKKPEINEKETTSYHNMSLDGTVHEVHVVFHMNPAITKAYTEKDKNKSKDDTPVDWIKVSTIAIALFALFQFVALIFQYCIMNKQDKTARLRDRAFIYLQPTVVFWPPKKPTALWAITMNIENAGNMPARQVSIRCARVTARKADNITDPFGVAEWPPWSAPLTVGPHKTLPLQAFEIDMITIEEMRKGTLETFVVAEAKYIDDFFRNRVTQISMRLNAGTENEYSFSITPDHNCADDDCQKQ